MKYRAVIFDLWQTLVPWDVTAANRFYDKMADAAGIDLRHPYDGYGPIAGAEGWLGIGSGLGLFGKASAGMLTGTMRAPFSETNNGGATIGPPPVLRLLLDLTDVDALDEPEL